MSRITNDSAPINAPSIPSDGSIMSPSATVDGFRPENLQSSMHPALARPSTASDVANVAANILTAAGGKLDRR
jgi:hypothetical protein